MAGAVQMAKRRGRGSEGVPRASVLVGATVRAAGGGLVGGGGRGGRGVRAAGAVLVAGAVRAARVARAAGADRVGVAVAASVGGARCADSASTRLGRSITKIPRACVATSRSAARSSRGASSARALDTSV